MRISPGQLTVIQLIKKFCYGICSFITANTKANQWTLFSQLNPIHTSTTYKIHINTILSWLWSYIIRHISYGSLTCACVWIWTWTCVCVWACNGVVWDCTWRGVLAPLMRDALCRGSGLFTVVVVVVATAAVAGLLLEVMFPTPLPWTLFDVEGGSNGGGEDESIFCDCSCCCKSRCCCWRCVTYSQ